MLAPPIHFRTLLTSDFHLPPSLFITDLPLQPTAIRVAAGSYQRSGTIIRSRRGCAYIELSPRWLSNRFHNQQIMAMAILLPEHGQATAVVAWRWHGKIAVDSSMSITHHKSNNKSSGHHPFNSTNTNTAIMPSSYKNQPASARHSKRALLPIIRTAAARKVTDFQSQRKKRGGGSERKGSMEGNCSITK